MIWLIILLMIISGSFGVLIMALFCGAKESKWEKANPALYWIRRAEALEKLVLDNECCPHVKEEKCPYSLERQANCGKCVKNYIERCGE